MLEKFNGMFGSHVGKLLDEPVDVLVDFGNQPPRKAKVYTEPTQEIPNLTKPFKDKGVGEGFVVIEELQPSGFMTWLMVHIDRLKKW